MYRSSHPADYEDRYDGDRRQGKGSRRGKHNANPECVELNKRIIKTSSEVLNGRRSFEDFLRDIESDIDRMNEVNLCTAFHRVAKTCPHDERQNTLNDYRFKDLQARVGDALSRSLLLLGSREGSQVPMSAACVCWAHATMRLSESSLFDEVAWRCAPVVAHFKNLELANLLWAFAKLGETGSQCAKLFHAAAEDIGHRAHDFSVVNFSTLAWAFATAKIRNNRFFRLIADNIVDKAAKAESQEIANTLWAFATANAFDKKLFRTLGDYASRKLAKFKAQEAANMAWAFGRANIAHLDLFKALEEHLRYCKAKGGMFDFAPQHFAMIMGAYGQLYRVERTEDKDEDQDKAENDEATYDENADDADAPPPQEGHSMAWSLAVIVLPECVNRIRRFKVEEAAKVYGACKSLGLLREEPYQGGDLQREAAEEARRFREAVEENIPDALTVKLGKK